MSQTNGDGPLVRIYEEILLLVVRYNRSSFTALELAAGFWLEYVQGGYAEIEKQFDHATFMRKFVWTRCMRELTRQLKANSTHSSSDVLEDVLSAPDRTDEAVIIEERRTYVSKTMSLIDELGDRREVITAKMLADGFDYRAIRRTLRCSLGTVHNIVQRLKERSQIKEIQKMVHDE